MIYLDHAATTFVYPDIIKIISEDLKDFWGNASTSYAFGHKSKFLIEQSREKIARVLNVTPEEIYFTSGSSEGNAWALSQKSRCLCSPYEHHNITENPKSTIIDKKYLLDAIKLQESNQDFGICLGDYSSFILSWMYVNNETGEIFNPSEFKDYAHRLNMFYHCDMTQALGNIPINLKDVDIATFSGHKIHAPKGVGFIYFNKDTFPVDSIKPLIYGGDQESHRRAGTENIPYIHALALAVDRAVDQQKEKERICKKLKRAFLEELANRFYTDDYMIVSPANSINSTICVCFHNVEGEILQSMLDEQGIYVGTGSACNTGEMNPSSVLTHMGIPEDYIRGEIRISMNEEQNTESDLRKTAELLQKNYSQIVQRSE